MKLTIKMKLAAAFLVVFALAGASTFLGLRDLSQANVVLNDVVNLQSARVLAVDRLELQQTQFGIVLRDYAIAQTPEERAALKAEIAAIRTQMTESIETLTTLADDRGRAMIENYDAVRATARDINNRVFELADRGDQGAASHLLATELRAGMRDLSAALAPFRDLYKNEMVAAAKAAERDLRGSFRNLLILSAAAGIFGSLAAIWIVLSITRGLGTALHVAQRVADRRSVRDRRGQGQRRDRGPALRQQHDGSEAARGGGRRDRDRAAGGDGQFAHGLDLGTACAGRK